MLDKIKALQKSVAEKTGRRPAEPKSQHIVALDIGTVYVKALIARVNDDKLEVVGMGRVRQDVSDMQAGAIADIAAVVSNCDKALHEAEQQAGVTAKSAVIGIAGELVKGTTTTVRITRKAPDKPLDIEEIERIIHLVQKRSEEKAKKQLTWEMGGKEVEIRLVNSALVNIDIDGYKVTNPIGFQGKDVVVQLYTAFAPMIHIGALERTAQELDLDLLAVAAEPFAVARSVIGDDANTTLSAVILDVGGGTTDIAVLDEGGVQGTKMFGIGGRAYTRSIERELGISYKNAEELKVALSDNRVAPAKRPVLEGALQKTLDVWASGIELALSEFTNLDHLPNKILLCGGGASLDMLVARLGESDWYSKLPFSKKPIVQHINPKQVVGIVDKSGQVADHTFITAMGLLRVGLDTLQQSDDLGASGSIRERIDKILRV